MRPTGCDMLPQKCLSANKASALGWRTVSRRLAASLSSSPTFSSCSFRFTSPAEFPACPTNLLRQADFPWKFSDWCFRLSWIQTRETKRVPIQFPRVKLHEPQTNLPISLLRPATTCESLWNLEQNNLTGGRTWRKAASRPGASRLIRSSSSTPSTPSSQGWRNLSSCRRSQATRRPFTSTSHITCRGDGWSQSRNERSHAFVKSMAPLVGCGLDKCSQSSSASFGSTDYSQVDMPDLRYRFVNFGPETTPWSTMGETK